ncbi:peptidase M19 renal dipeptidase [Ferrimonas balearica DSM 9799]|uniref:Peptidase M19 renal dipeptidase n=1 Tax=Ferrimonas balearica (strain DSM 9799 / CCM 4581 / KCTC 23876 / PAT) TaxID=550540 RepID=E1SVJ0_FERBD|nr:membrane dipeptidase [Ferrimonas balearica]ADN75336.1 peptidase M19 renal dipeptidase [Ferrimonas balearica DSM 9799]
MAQPIRMIRFLTLILGLLLCGPAAASLEAKRWPASDKAKAFVKETIVLGMMASPYGTGWTENSQLLEYYRESRAAGITGHEITRTAASQNWDELMRQHKAFRSAMAQEPQNYVFVRAIRDIEAAHINGQTAVLWNSQTATILEEDLGRMAAIREMGIISMILTYNDRFRAGSGSLAAYNGMDDGLTDWGRAVIDEMVRYGVILDLSHTGKQTAMDAMDHMDKHHSGVPYVFTHSIPAGLYKSEPDATPKGCYRNISDEEALRVVKSGGYVSPTFTEWMMDGIWPDNISPSQAADMIDYYVKLLGEDHVGLATDDMFDVSLVVEFAKKNATMYNDGGYMIEAFERGADDSAMLARILPAITDELWKRGYTDAQLTKIYGGNKMRVYQQIWEGAEKGQWDKEYEERIQLRKAFMERYGTR